MPPTKAATGQRGGGGREIKTCREQEDMETDKEGGMARRRGRRCRKLMMETRNESQRKTDGENREKKKKRGACPRKKNSIREGRRENERKRASERPSVGDS